MLSQPLLLPGHQQSAETSNSHKGIFYLRLFRKIFFCSPQLILYPFCLSTQDENLRKSQSRPKFLRNFFLLREKETSFEWCLYRSKRGFPRLSVVTHAFLLLLLKRSIEHSAHNCIVINIPISQPVSSQRQRRLGQKD